MKAAALLLVVPAMAFGQTQYITRNTSSVVGGFGQVNSALKVLTTTGQQQTAFEWGVLSLLNNHSDAGENVAVYGQANAFGKGPSWGGVFEVADDSGRPGPMVGTEITMNMSGQDSGLRLGLDVVLADGKYWRGRGSSEVSEGTVGVRVGTQDSSTAKKSWRVGFSSSGFRVAGLHTEGPALHMPEGWIATGTYSGLINAYGGKFSRLVKFSSQSPAFRFRPLGDYVGSLLVEIDGNPYAVPIYTLR